jgi:hypothetical protein
MNWTFAGPTLVALVTSLILALGSMDSIGDVLDFDGRFGFCPPYQGETLIAAWGALLLNVLLFGAWVWLSRGSVKYLYADPGQQSV